MQLLAQIGAYFILMKRAFSRPEKHAILYRQTMREIEKTGKKPFDFVRTQESDYRTKFKGQEISDKEWIKILTENPKLLQRPIVVNGDKAVLANPPGNIESIL